MSGTPRPVRATDTTVAWTLLPTLVVRSAGFCWQLVDGLAYRRCAGLAERLADLEERAEALRGRLADHIAARGAARYAATKDAAAEDAARDAAAGDGSGAGHGSAGRLTRGQRARIRTGRALDGTAPVPGDWLAEWNALAARVAEVRAQLPDAEAADAAGVSGALHTLAADPRFLDAVACSGPGVARDILRGRPHGARIRRQIASYAQRLATKCETMSTFGPVNYAAVADGGDAGTRWSWAGHRGCGERRALLSAWAFDGVLARVLGDPVVAGRAVPRRKTFDRLPGTGGALAALARAVDGERALGAIAADCRLDPAVAAGALAQGVRQGFLAHDAQPPATEVDPTRWLAARLGTAPAELRGVLGLLDRYPAADAATKLTIQAELESDLHAASRPPFPAGRDPARSGSRFYNDRVVVTEAAVGTLDMTIGGELARDLREAVPAALDLLARVAAGTRERTNAALARTLGSGRFPLVRVLRDGAGLPVSPDPWLTDAVARAVAAAPDADEIDLAPVVPGPPGAPLPVLGSVDVMVSGAAPAGAAPTGDALAGYRSGRDALILGDVHDAPLLTPWALQFHPDRGAILAHRDGQIERVLAGRSVLNVVARRSTGLPPLRFPGPVLEIGAVDGPAERVALDRLYVHSDGRQARLLAEGRPGDLFLHNGELDSGVHTALALPRLRPVAVPDLAYVPRLRYGCVVLSRRRWRLRTADLLAALAHASSTVDVQVAVCAWRRRGRVPAQFFARAPHERKPIYVDTSSPLLVDCLLRLARGGEVVYASEVLPDRDGLWLREGDLRFAAEFRCVYLRPADPGGVP